MAYSIGKSQRCKSILN